MPLILGIDAAWTHMGSSGVALLDCTNGGRVVACAPSYASFINLSNGTPVDWASSPSSGLDAYAVLGAAVKLGRGPVDVVAVDMPMATTTILGRRLADQEISRKFGSAWAGTHSPNANRPGVYGHSVTQKFIEAGYPLATNQDRIQARSLIEVYPLAALVRLMNVPKRPLYKVSKSSREWPKLSREERILKLLETWHKILECLNHGIGDLNFPMPEGSKTLSALKPYEDALDAIISAYVGALFLKGLAEAHGDSEGAIWVPKNGAVQPIGEDRYLTAAQETLTEWNSFSDAQAFRNL